MSDAHTAFIGLGSNVGDRARHLRAAVGALGETGRIAQVSSVYESAPIGFVDQRPFWNAVVELHTALEPAALLARLQAIEARLGRTPTFRDGPREIDLDILLYDDVVDEGPPILPHPRMAQRAFVLRPLLELHSDLRDPRDDTYFRDRLEDVAGQALTACADGSTLMEEGAS